MASVKLSWGYFGCGRSPVSESGRISAALWGARWSFGTAGQRITDILCHQMTLKGELVKGKIHILSLKLTRTIVWCQSSSNSRRNSVFHLSCLLFPFTSSFLLECKEKWKLLTENQMMKLLQTSMSKLEWQKIKLVGYVMPNNVGPRPKLKPQQAQTKPK